MANKKNQHFVPKLYLKQFSVNNDNATIGLFHLDNNLFLAKVPLKHQAKETYFYGEDGYLEEQLSKLEALAAPCLKEIAASNSLPKKESPEYFRVFSFTVILANRTKDAAEQVK